MARPKKVVPSLFTEDTEKQPYLAIVKCPNNKYKVRVHHLTDDKPTEFVDSPLYDTALEAKDAFKIAAVKLFWGK
jgi:hypothetical protein